MTETAAATPEGRPVVMIGGPDDGLELIVDRTLNTLTWSDDASPNGMSLYRLERIRLGNGWIEFLIHESLTDDAALTAVLDWIVVKLGGTIAAPSDPTRQHP